MKLDVIYAVTNPAWPEWLKIGRTAYDTRLRKQGYNICSPFKDYSLEVLFETSYSVRMERLTQSLVAKHFERAGGEATKPGGKSEWFKCSLKQVKDLLAANAQMFREEGEKLCAAPKPFVCNPPQAM